ncbi:sulfurtransferase [Microvirgula aerodenitrificans]|uniref:sulfurtransferase n=1 Tax=Microvirgula aerodenitrificans TaxID=57480 RepID=UPI00248E8B65|nr:sulfurtransferase [Microvirgula aerodenitrificans]
MYRTLISVDELAVLPPESVLLIDCRHQLADPDYGRGAYAAGHLPDAHHLHLDYHLSGPTSGSNGRHPLPDRQRLAVVLGALGLAPGIQCVAYDDAGGMFAARLWWLAQWLGHHEVAVLDGGIQAWTAAGHPLTRAEAGSHPPVRFLPRDGGMRTVTADEVLANIDRAQFQLVDARGADRFRGENETIDPVGGHIPGAINHPFAGNLASDGRFKPAATLRDEWETQLGGRPPQQVVHQCGSGVTACHNLLSMEYAGLNGSRLYPGSWSEWVAAPGRPCATGA